GRWRWRCWCPRCPCRSELEAERCEPGRPPRCRPRSARLRSPSATYAAARRRLGPRATASRCSMPPVLVPAQWPLVAQTVPTGGSRPAAWLAGGSPVLLLVLLGALSLLPFVLLVGTSFVKVSVVLGMVRNALGTQQIPSGMVITGLSAILTLHIMAP